MPRFNEKEKELIKIRLFAEGERLFAAYGLKKVTIDELVSAVNIAKATFYTFYESKEYLYLDIVQNIQLIIFSQLDGLLEANRRLTSKQRVRLLFQNMYELMIKYPILSQIDQGTIQLISRKVSGERLASFSGQNVDGVKVLIKHGILFSCEPEIASAAFGALYQGWISLQNAEKSIQEKTADLLLNAVIEQLVQDT